MHKYQFDTLCSLDNYVVSTVNKETEHTLNELAHIINTLWNPDMLEMAIWRISVT